ncbi:MAG: hypothetical protein K2W85_17540 [Phycisphaerales bacterium]|nr:hypothetical protein [Phycisphaerales bacterium]
MQQGTSRASGRWWSVVVVLSFAVVLAMATFYVGDTGVYNDDYFLNQRDPATGQIESLVMNRPWHLWRPVTRVVLPALVSTLWDTPWALHLISALLHAAVVGLGYGLMRRVDVSAGISAAGALVFMVYPVHFEAVLWIAIICTLMSVVLVLLIWHGYAWWLARGHLAGAWTRAGLLAAMAVAAWTSAAMNEQPPGVLAAMPLLVMMLGWAQGKSWSVRVWRTLVPVLAVGCALAFYLLGFFRHKTSLTPTEVPESATQNLLQLVEKVPSELALVGFARGALVEGAAAAIARPALVATGFGFLGIVGLVWMLRAFNRDSSDGPGASRSNAAWLMALGLCWTLLAWLPVAAAHAVTSPRLHYVPTMGLMLVVCGAAMLVASGVGRMAASLRGVVFAVARLATCAVVAMSVIMWVGVCEHLQRRYRADEGERRSLAAAIGGGIEGGTMLVPVRVDSVTAATGSPRFDGYFRHSWFWQFSAGWSVRLALRRADVHTYQTVYGVAAGGPAGEMLWLSDEDPLRWVLIRSTMAPPRPGGHWQDIPRSKRTHARLLPLDRCVFFEVVRPGQVEVFTVVRLHGTFGEPIDLFLRQTALMQKGRVPPIAGRRLELFMMPEDVRRSYERNP